MVEKFLLDLFRRSQKQKIAVLIDGDYTSPKILSALPTLMEKLREFGDIKIAEVVYDSKISDDQYKALMQVGFTQNIVAGNLDLHFLFQCYDIALSDNTIEMIVVGTNRTNLIPLFTELRKEVTTYALLESHQSKSFEECFDGVIMVDSLDDFTFSTTEISEVSSLMNTNGNGESAHEEIANEEVILDANIGPMSDTMEEQTTLIEELKQKESEVEEVKDEVVEDKTSIHSEIVKKPATKKRTKKATKSTSKKSKKKK